MKFLVISDLHAHNDVLDKMDAQFKEADGVLFAGDFAECFKPFIPFSDFNIYFPTNMDNRIQESCYFSHPVPSWHPHKG